MKQTGFTLIELLVTMVVIAVLAGLAAPAFAEMIAAQRRLDAAQQLASGLRTARLEAILRQEVTMLHAIDGQWAKGWRISLNPSGKGPGDESDTLLIERAYSGDTPIVGRLRGMPYVVFNRLGAPSTYNGTLFICEKHKAISHHRVVLAVTGRVTLISGKAATPLCQEQ